MNGYTSGTQARDGRKVNHDPYPNVWEGHSPRNQMRADTDMFRKGAPFNHERYRYLPRPEFDVPDNPILARFRERIEETWEHPYWGDAWDSTMDYIGFASDFPYRVKETSAEIDHARRVLSKLAAAYA